MPLRKNIMMRLAAVSLALLVAGCGILDPRSERPGEAEAGRPEPSYPAGPGVPDPGGGRGLTAFTKGCPAEADRVASGTGGRQLRATTLNYGAIGFNRDVAITEQTLKEIPQLLDRKQYDDFDAVYAAGAFAAGGGMASVTLENTGSTTLSIYDVRPVNIVQECLPLTALILYRNEGGDPTRMTFNLDAATPVARAIDLNGNVGGPYFVEFPPIQLRAGGKEGYLLQFTTVYGAYSFDLLVAYESGGTKYATLLRNGFQPFRIATSLCPRVGESASLSEETVAHLKALRFGNVRVRREFDVVAISPDEQARACANW